MIGADLAARSPKAVSRAQRWAIRDDAVIGRRLTSQSQHVITLKLKGEIVGEYVDTQFLPGYTFGWSPQSARQLHRLRRTGRDISA